MIDMRTKTFDIEVRPQKDGIRVINSDNNAQASCPLVDVTSPTGMSEQVPVPHINLSISRYDPNLLSSSHTRTHNTGIQESIPQLDRPVSVLSRTRRRLSENTTFEQESL